jgi:cyclic beta-1,2-glucan synthetase
LLAGIRYVITLDADTRLPRDVARRLVGVALHPLNRPHYEGAAGRVTRGYGILQPRVSIALEGASRSRFARIFAGQAGLDPYTTAASDVYQDLFGEGSFTGKGLYDVDAFETALEGRIPDNSILSHDLFEGLHARCALVTDVELFDDCPAQYDSYARRGYRWVRGDWQIARWLFARVPGADGRSVRNPLPLISRWKIFDNMRRSLVAPSMLLWLAFVWAFVPGRPAWWTLFIIVTLGFPIYANFTAGVSRRARAVAWTSHLRGVWGDAKKNTAQFLVVITGLGHQAYLNADAVVRTLYRTLVSRRRLLEWMTAAQAEQGRARNLADMLRFMWPGVLIAFAAAALVAAVRPSALVVAAPFLLAWACSPYFMHLLSRRAGTGPQKLSVADTRVARLAARRTWRFFEEFVGTEDNWLPPDNFQEDPKPVVAHRTSPTNIGLLLLATVAAHDLGYVGTLELVERLELTLDTLQRLPKFRGHLFNWYDTRTLEPLNPQYVSTVDSGNFAGHLLALRQACIELPERTLFGAHTLEGIADTVALLRQELERVGAARKRTEVVSVKHLREEVVACAVLLETGPPEHLSGWETLLNSLHRHATAANDMLAALGQEYGTGDLAEVNFWSGALLRQLKEFARDLRTFAPNDYPAGAVLPRLSRLAQECEKFFGETDFTFLFDDEREVFRIGFNVASASADNSFYDLLASEARLASFIAIAKGDVPQEHWFRLGRQLTPVDGGRALISWTASMFEYLMPLLVMRDYEGTLLDETYRAVVGRQIEYGAERRVPWGISEAAYNARDLQLNYQYSPFGVPGLGLKRGLSEDLVVAPYATMLAALVAPRAAFENLRRLEREGALARFGYYEAIDYTPERLPKGQRRVVVRAFMAHHQGMSLVALDNLINGDVMRQRFHAEPLVQATELLLQERVPRDTPASHPRAEEVLSSRVVHTPKGVETRVYDTADLPTPRTQLLSAGTYSVMLTTAGAGFSARGPVAVTRWREDATCDNYGSFIYLHDVRGGEVWSAGRQPVRRKPQAYEVTLAEDKIDIRRSDAGVLTHTEITVTPEDDAELRRVSLTNRSSRVREIEVTSYAEVVLAPPAADVAHPAFSNLFVETEFVAATSALVARRRPRSSNDEPVFGVHTVVTEGESVGAIQYETDRSRFLGRGHTTADPVAVFEERPLSNTVGAVLDPVFALRQRVRLQPGETARLTFTTAVAHTREQALALAEKYHDPAIFERAAQLAWTQSRVEMRHFNIDAEEAHLFQRLAGRVLYADPSLRPRPHTLALNSKTQAGLWQYGISGDLPIVLARIGTEEDLEVARQLLRAHGYLRLKGLAIDLVILNDHPTSYIQTVQEELQALLRSSGSQGLQDKPGGVYLRRSDLMPDADRILLHSVARVVIVAERGTLEEQLVRREIEPELPPNLTARAPQRVYPAAPPRTPELSFFNGLGGFSEGGREYVITLGEGQWTPAPWTNVVANEHDFGFQVSETGAGYTWSVNSRENRLTPWSNDSVSDPPGEVVYLRDEETGEVWTPTPLPIRETEPYVVRHGQGYTIFEHTSNGIAQELLLFVPSDAPLKISRLRLRNTTERRRRLSVTSYNELTLGVGRGASAPYIITEIDAESGAIFARNPYNNEFAGRVAFADVSLSERSATCDRKEFIGRNGSRVRPAALGRTRLAGRDGAGLDPCAALQATVELAPGEYRELFFLFGEGESREEAESILARFRRLQSVDEAFEQTLARWDETLETIRVRTPDPSLDMLLNRWLLCQTLACRVWARSAFYQSGGAYGFRDQLQDVMAVVYSRADVTRAQILRAAAHQFKEGDVQHWWHPPTGRGVRTRFSDDLLWLPYVTAFYVNVTGDLGVLDEVVPFVEAPPLAEGEDESYTQPTVSAESATLFEHCVRALDRSMKTGAHGLPLMGSGDWNDGMNRVGNLGRGESVWVGWFLHTTLSLFAPLCEERGESERARVYLDHVAKLKQALEAEAWDGDWYRRAYFDDGTPLGSAQNEECRIDSIAQSWGVISGAADPHRAQRAMAAVEEHLIRRGDGLVMLFTPPFDRGALDPGYIKGYVPGVRENGGQYTHAALWVLIAYAIAGDGDRAGELFALLNPINHASTLAGLHKYKVEPYVAAADVYAVHPHTGRGGWTWYTGSASWMYRAGLEYILGFRLRGASLRIEPCIPRGWREYEIDYRHGSSRYRIRVENPSGSTGRGLRSVEVDGEAHASVEVTLKDDGSNHQVRVVLG